MCFFNPSRKVHSLVSSRLTEVLPSHSYTTSSVSFIPFVFPSLSANAMYLCLPCGLGRSRQWWFQHLVRSQQSHNFEHFAKLKIQHSPICLPRWQQPHHIVLSKNPNQSYILKGIRNPILPYHFRNKTTMHYRQTSAHINPIKAIYGSPSWSRNILRAHSPSSIDKNCEYFSHALGVK